MDSIYMMPITQTYERRGCKVSINAAANSNRVDVGVYNIKSGYGSSYSHVINLAQAHDRGYTEEDVKTIKAQIDTMLETYGEPECQEVHFTNQILS